MPTDTIFREYNHIDSDHSDRSANDRLRHRQKIRDALREGIGEIIADESIIGQDGDKIVKVPVKSIREYRFVFGDNSPDTTSGDGDEKPGDVIGKRRSHKPGGPGGGDGGGNSGGMDVVETEITVAELIDIMFEDLGLPELERKALQEIEIESVKRSGYRRKGIRVRLDPKRTIVEKTKRKLAAQRLEKDDNSVLEEEEERFPFRNEDLRYKHMKIDKEHESNAVVFCIMDVSGSMDQMKKYLARSFFFLLWTWVKRQYQHVEVVFIAHHDSAKEVTQEEFFYKGESGGTICSSGYELAHDIIYKRYHPSLWNIYTFHCSDGDNYTGDNERAIKAAHELVKISKLFGYGEIVPNQPHGDLFAAIFGGSQRYEYPTLLKLFAEAYTANPSDWAGFFGFRCANKEDIWAMFKQMLSVEKK